MEDAVQHLTTLIQEAAWLSTPERKKTTQKTNNIPLHVKELVREKRSERLRWQNTRSLLDKTHVNRLTHNLRSAIRQAKNDTFKLYTANLTPDDHSLWKATKKFKRPTMAIPPLRKPHFSWARSNTEKTNQFAQHLAKVFTPHPRNNNDDEIEAYLDVPYQLSPPLKAVSSTQVHRAINQLNPQKAPGYDSVDGTILKKLPRKAIVLLTSIFNSMIRLCYFPVQWKYAQILMIAKPRKPPPEASSYRPISLLLILSKVF